VQHGRPSADNALRNIGIKDAERDRSALDGLNRQHRAKIGQVLDAFDGVRTLKDIGEPDPKELLRLTVLGDVVKVGE
jgi:hypothetical protein